MEKFYLILLAFFLSVWSTQAQKSVVFNYQGVARDTSNQPFKKQPLQLNIQILDKNNMEVYSEDHSDIVTSNLGVFSIQIGNGTHASGDLSTIDWENGGPFYLQVSISIGAGTSKKLAPSQLVFVPNALYSVIASKAHTLDGFTPGPGIDISANKVSNTGVLNVQAGTGIDVQGTATPTILNKGVLTVTAGTGIALQGDAANPMITNAGVLKTDQAGGQINGTFANLSISIPNAKDGDVLRYDQTNQKWIPGSAVPVGTIMPFGGSKAKIPAGWLLCDGSEVQRSTYSALLDVIGELWGGGNGTSTFNLPDLRGEFLRGTAYESSKDPDKDNRTRASGSSSPSNEVGSIQDDALQYHEHQWHASGNYAGDGAGWDGPPGNGTNQTFNIVQSGSHDAPRLGEETRSKNVYVNYIIKY